MTRFNLKTLKKSLYLSCMFIGAFSLTACNTYYFDSSVGPDGQTVKTEQVKTHKKSANKNNKKTVTNKKKTQSTVKPEDKAKSDLVAKAFNQEMQAGVVKPYVPEGSAAQTEGSLLPVLNELKDKENSSPLASVSVKDVVQGNVDLNKLNQDQNSNNNVETQTKVPQAFVPEENTPQDLNKLEKDENANTDNSQEVEIANSNEESTLESLQSAPSSSKCGTANTSNAAQIAYKIALGQAQRLKNEQGPVYIAPTVVPDSSSDCIGDLSGAIRQALNSAGIETVTGAGVDVSQNSGSSTVIPSLVRACRQSGVPILNVSVIRHIGPKTVINIRNMRAKDGITLVQNTSQL
ncbi:MAG: hypothetical protein IJ254_07850 [Succinivibrio sp.]|jgi:predicted small secreted protein|nr:hypothetical protein [Succinivibrio sp.]